MVRRSPSPSKKHPEIFQSSWPWRLLILVAIVLRTWLSVSPSYIHPDEHFQGPESLADVVFGWATKKSWEFLGDAPARSYFVAWTIYGLPMTFIETMFGTTKVNPTLVLYSLRLLFNLGSWIFSDMALDRLTLSKNHKFAALFFYSTSYVSWTYQSHTFSNSVETVLLLWCLVIIHEFQTKRLYTFAKYSDSALLGCLAAFGLFNRVTFPAFLVIPGLRLLVWYVRYPMAFLTLLASFLFTSLVAIYFDTIWVSVAANYDNSTSIALQLLEAINNLGSDTPLVVAPLNNLLYNMDVANLALHGIHSRFQHVLVNLPQLLGPALVLLFSTKYVTSIPFQSAISGLMILSCVQHQEVRFLTPIIPLLCCCLNFDLLKNRKWLYSTFFIAWVSFNIAMGLLMGLLHQGGIIPTQVHISNMVESPEFTAQNNIFLWWKTYSPPIWLLGKPVGSVQVIDPDETVPGGGENVFRYQPIFEYLDTLEAGLDQAGFKSLKGPSKAFTSTNKTNNSILNPTVNLTVVDLMGASPDILNEITNRLSLYSSLSSTMTNVYLVAPLSAALGNNYLVKDIATAKLNEVFRASKHLSLDDIDFTDLKTLIPGLGTWKLEINDDNNNQS